MFEQRKTRIFPYVENILSLALFKLAFETRVLEHDDVTYGITSFHVS
jgi:hypothetical protein